MRFRQPRPDPILPERRVEHHLNGAIYEFGKIQGPEKLIQFLPVWISYLNTPDSADRITIATAHDTYAFEKIIKESW